LKRGRRPSEGECSFKDCHPMMNAVNRGYVLKKEDEELWRDAARLGIYANREGKSKHLTSYFLKKTERRGAGRKCLMGRYIQKVPGGEK